MAKDNAMTIGQLVGHIGVRDAIHCPIISAVAKMNLNVGTPVVILESGEAEQSDFFSYVGIVDPFLKAYVQKGEQFWVWVKPGSISSLTHKWTHNRIPDVAEVVPEKEAARVRLEEFANGPLHVSLEEMLAVIAACATGHGDPLYDHGYEGLSEYEGFWDDYMLYTGKPDPNQSRDFYGFFTCGGCS